MRTLWGWATIVLFSVTLSLMLSGSWWFLVGVPPFLFCLVKYIVALDDDPDH